MENKFLLEAILKPFNLPDHKKKEIAVQLNLPGNTQKDLMFMSAILVSTGTNRNGATFLGSELIKARGSISQKALDIEHVEDKIIGHIVSSIFMDFEGNLINDEELYEEFSKASAAEDLKKVAKKLDALNIDIGIVCAIYRDRFPQLSDEIENGAWKVSMECYYKDYDLKVGSLIMPKGIAKERYCDNKELNNAINVVFTGTSLGTSDVSRVLRDISFCGVGVVKNPANERSIILEAAKVEEEHTPELQAAASESKILTTLQVPGKGWSVTLDNKEILQFFTEENYDAAIQAAAKIAIDQEKDVFVLNTVSVLKTSDKLENSNLLGKVIYYKINKDNNIIKVIPYENKEEVVEIMENKDLVNESAEDAALLEKQGIKVPKNIDDLKQALPVKPALDISAITIPLHEIIDLLWFQVYTRPTVVPEINSPATYDATDNLRHYREQSFVLPKKQLFSLDLKESIISASKVYSYVLNKMTAEDRDEAFYNIMYAAVIHEVDLSQFEQKMEEEKLSITNIKEFSSKFAVPRLEMMPLDSREQIIAAMSRCMHIKENLTDKEKEYMVVNILKAAKGFNIDCTGFKERVKRLNF